MADWLKNKDLGPWAFTERGDVWGYCNNPNWTDTPKPPVSYTGRESEEPQIWTANGKGRFGKQSTVHNPCGHWHKEGASPVVIGLPEIYWELLNSQSAQPYLIYHDDLLSLHSFTEINADDFDGDVTWAAEIIGNNAYAFDVTVQIVDDLGVVCAETILAAGTTGSTGYELFRTRVEFTPSPGDRSFGVKIIKAPGNNIYSFPLKLILSTVRIIVAQEGATKTRIQIPLMGDQYNYDLQDYATSPGAVGEVKDLYPYSRPLGRSFGSGDDLTFFTDHWGGYGGDYSEIFTTIWKYEEAILNTVSKVTFSVLARGHIPSIEYTKVTYVSSSVDIGSFHLMLYSTPYGSPTGSCLVGDPVGWVSDSQVHTDSCTGTVFTPVPGSMVHIDPASHPYTSTSYPNFSSTGHYNYHLGGEINVGVWGHFSKFFDFNIPAGAAIIDTSLTVESTSDNQQTWTFRYKKTVSADIDFTVALWNMTQECLVAGSEMVWHKAEDWNRKKIEIASSELKDGCEYEFVIKCPEYIYFSPKCGESPELADAQLWLNVDPINKLTVWQRCARTYDGYNDNYTIPISWGGDYWGDSEGSNSVGCRVGLVIPAGAIVRYEQTAYVCESYPEEVLADLYCAILEDLGVDNNDGVSGVDVSDGKLIWDLSTYYTKRARLRTGPLVLTGGNYYGVRLPDANYWTIMPNNGFIVISV